MAWPFKKEGVNTQYRYVFLLLPLWFPPWLSSYQWPNWDEIIRFLWLHFPFCPGQGSWADLKPQLLVGTDPTTKQNSSIASSTAEKACVHWLKTVSSYWHLRSQPYTTGFFPFHICISLLQQWDSSFAHLLNLLEAWRISEVQYPCHCEKPTF